MTFLLYLNPSESYLSKRNVIKASAGKRRLGVRVESRGFSRDGHQESLSRSKWVAVGGGK